MTTEPAQFQQVRMADDWYQFADEAHFWIVWRLELLRSMLAPFAAAPLRCLDVGCGDGTTSRLLELSSQFVIDGCELNSVAFNASKLGKGQLFVYDIISRTRTSDPYDMLLLLDVLEHIEDPAGFLHAARDHLKPGGLIALNVPAHQWLYSKYDQAAGHVMRHNKDSLHSLLGATNFEVLDSRYWGLSLVPLAMLRKIYLACCSDREQIIRRGFEPPSNFFAEMLSILGGLERRLIANCPTGTSLLTLARLRT